MLTSLWERLLTAVSAITPDKALESWLRTCHLAALDGDHLRIKAPNKHARHCLLQQHMDSLERAARQVLGGNPHLSFETDRDAHASPSLRPPGDAAPAISTGLASRYTFDTFVVGNSNQFAQAACQAVAELPSKAYNP